MNVIEINSFNYGSTGNIMLNIAKAAQHNGFEMFYACVNGRDCWPKVDEKTILIGNRFFRKIHLWASYNLGLSGLLSVLSTINFLAKIKKLNPCLIHLHNLHCDYINLPILFYFIKKNNIPVIWTLHDCWSFTGRCPYFDITMCNKWKTGCHNCPYPKSYYPSSKIDTTKFLWLLKRRWFTGVKAMTIVTPSQWLADLVKQSYLKDYPVKVINNGIDLNVFKPTEGSFRSRFNLVGCKVVLGVAFGWGVRKGLDVFVKLAKRLPDDYRVVLVGTNEKVEKNLPANVISIRHTQNQTELAKIYTAADVFVNPTREENYPTVNMECLACGTPVITFKTGGSPEIIDETCGSVILCDDVDAMEKEIRRVCEKKVFSKEACLIRAKSFDMNDCFEKYVEMYKECAK